MINNLCGNSDHVFSERDGYEQHCGLHVRRCLAVAPADGYPTHVCYSVCPLAPAIVHLLGYTTIAAISRL